MLRRDKKNQVEERERETEREAERDKERGIEIEKMKKKHQHYPIHILDIAKNTFSNFNFILLYFIVIISSIFSSLISI